MASNHLLFLDTSWLDFQEVSNLWLKVFPLRKDFVHSPLFGEDYFADPPKTWQPRIDNGYPNVVYDEQEKLYRLYYTAFVKDAASESTPLAGREADNYYKAGRQVALCYAESADGIVWDRPNLGICEFEGSKHNNILLLGAHGSGVLYDPTDPDPNRKYKLICRYESGEDESQVSVAFSGDGIHFSDLVPCPDFKWEGNTHNFPMRDEQSGKYFLFTRDVINGMRAIIRLTSKDFLHWEDKHVVACGISPASQVYSMPVFPYGGLYFGLASIYHEGNRESENYDLVDLCFAFGSNPDYLTVITSQDWIKHGPGKYPAAAFDAGCIFAAPPIRVGERDYVYYFGSNGQHSQFRETSFARAQIDLKRMAALVAADESRPFEVLTLPLAFTGNQVRLLSEGAHPSIRYRLLDPKTKEPIVGYDYEDCLPITRSGWQNLSFQGRMQSPWPEKARIQLEVEESALFALDGSVEKISR
ncbi:hypothetical protein [Boudabousia tangfeifanii]|uniref:hypothetical protein n=1 Tax=Boudabousia tangfeifanii TaxID=1912795 RepID=UPI0012EDA421|nr:hypothetical protein [Boudabousia tangfeifanii]